MFAGIKMLLDFLNCTTRGLAGRGSDSRPNNRHK